MFAIKNYNNSKSYASNIEIEKLNKIDFNKDCKAHEWLTHSMIVKPYYDIDEYFDNEKEYNTNKRKLKLKWRKILQEKYPDSDIAMSCSSRYKNEDELAKKNKGKNWFVSLHFIVNNYKIEMSKLEDYNIFIGLDKIEGYDKSVYSNGQNFRLVNQSKCGSNVPLKPLNYKDDLYKFVIQYTTGEDKLINHTISPAVSPVSSDNEEEEKKEIIKKDVEKCSKDKFLKLINGIKPRYEYKDWLNIGYICFNNFDGSEEGLNIWNDYSKKDDENYEGKAKLKTQYEYFKKQKSNNKLSFLTLQKWYNEDNPIKNIYEYWYKNNILVEKMNETTMYFTKDATIIYYNKGERLRNDIKKATTYFNKFCFKIINQKGIEIEINPLTYWLKQIDRRDFNHFQFNPFTLDSSENCYNTWKGYKILNTKKFDEKNIEPILFHIKDVMANGDNIVYEYLLNYFAHLLQKPYQRTCVCLCFKSIEGTGKTLFLDIIRKIMGEDLYTTTNEMDRILGRFNDLSANKILINFNETNWGGDIKSKGKFKALITDDKIAIEEKGKSIYITDNYANCIITSNNEWLISISKDDRRFCAIECKNEPLSKTKYEIINKIDLQEIANYFYNRDISNFDSRLFPKTKFHEEQIQLNWDSVQNFVNELLNEEFNKYDDMKIGKGERIEKDVLYTYYIGSCQASHSNKLNNVWFNKKLKKLIPSLKYINATKKNSPCIEFTKNIEEMKQDFKNAVY